MSKDGLNHPPATHARGRVLVTGGAGFIGSHLCAALLERGYEVVVADTLLHGNKIPPALRPHLELAEVDVRSAEGIDRLSRGCRFVFHLASILGVEVVADQPVLTMETEIDGTRNVAAAALAHGVERVVYTSTSSVYGHSVVEEMVTEEVMLDPRTTYAIAKRYNEIYLRSMYDEHGLESATIRPFNIYGSRQDERMVIPRFIRQARAGEPLSVFGDGLQTRDFTDVGETCTACIRLAESARGAEVFNVARGEEVTVLELARRIVALTGSRSPVTPVAAPEKRHDFEVRRRIGCSDKLERWTGFRPAARLDDGLRRLIEEDAERPATPASAPTAAPASAAASAPPPPRPAPTHDADAPALVILDFDGTLVRSHPLLAEISREVLARHGVEAPYDEVRALIGLPTRERFRRHGVAPERLAQAVADFDETHGRHDYAGVEPLPGLREWLDALPGGPRWILSAAPQGPLLASLQRLGLADAFDRVVCRHDGVAMDKVEQARRWSADGELPVAGGPIWYFGDEQGDLQAAAHLGAVFHLVEGEHNRHLRPLADHVLRDFRDLPLARAGGGEAAAEAAGA